MEGSACNKRVGSDHGLKAQRSPARNPAGWTERGSRPLRYSQKGMATTPNRNPTATPQAASQTGFVYLPLIAGWLVPGGGHFLLRRWYRGALLAASISGMFAMGLAMHGKLYASAHDILDLLGLAGDLGNGLLYVVSRAAGWGAESVQITVADWGTRFIVVAGMLNVISAIDAHNLRTGRKPAQ